jgi:hypothetical protein
MLRDDLIAEQAGTAMELLPVAAARYGRLWPR